MATTLEQRYQIIRMAVFDPRYLVTHTKCDEADFTRLIDEIIALIELKPSVPERDNCNG